MKHFIIRGYYDEDDKDYLYWSNDDGWVGYPSATVFEFKELYTSHLPMGTTAIIFSEV